MKTINELLSDLYGSQDENGRDMTDQRIADKLSTADDKIPQCVIFKWRRGLEDNEKLIRRYSRLVDLHKKVMRKKKIS